MSISELKYITFFSLISYSLQKWVVKQIVAEAFPVCFSTRSANITPLFKVHTTYDISNIHPCKSNIYAYENQTHDQQKISMNFKSTTQNTSDGQLESHVDFVFKKKKE